ncbi:slr1659 superfamily regulator [Kamptonema formosum]|uniref:slr1659 superfamily regulator n=1 Tax=Kamptonema formosum TaxID=331992 RepID=UPI00034CE0F7|nr:STAS domain-containing protein [Oscillatoria sp. PCC 10802]
MEIKSEDYSIWYEPDKATVTCQGALRLSGMDEYAPIVQLLNDAIDKHPPQLVLNLQELDFLNSSGINVLSKFVIKVRQNGNVNLVVRGSKNIPWQGKSLKNLQRLLPALQLELE